jgi:hypothetical protein
MMTFVRKDYTARDYDSIMAQAKQYLIDQYPNLLLDFSAMSPEQLFLDMFSFISDANHLYNDAAFSEFFVDTLAERQSGISLGKWNDYHVSMKSASSVTLIYTYTKLDGGAPNSVILPIGTTLTDKYGQTWTVTTPQTVSTTGGSTGFSMFQGNLVTDNWAASGEPNQEIISSRKSVASNVEPLIEFDSSTATRVDKLLNYSTGDYYERSFLGDTTFNLRMGDDVNGSMPSSTISAQYLITNGPDGNIPQGILTGKFRPVSDVEISYSNTSSASGGDDPESIDHIRQAIPAHTSALATLMTKQDYISLINDVSGVQFSSVSFNTNLRRNVCYVMSSSYGAVTDLMLELLRRTLMLKYALNSSVIFKNIDFANIVVHVKVFLESDRNISKDTKLDEIQTAIEAFFQPGTDDPIYCATGEPIRISDFYGMLESINGVDYVEIDVFTRKPSLIPDTWSESVRSLELKSWALRPSYKLDESQLMGTGAESISLTDTEDPVEAQVGVTRIYGSGAFTSIPTLVEESGGRLLTGDWTQQLSQVPLEKVRVQMSNLYGNYRWASWIASDNTIPIPMRQTGAESQLANQTAHFAVSHFLDNVEYRDSGIGYVGRSYQLDSGTFTFRLDSPNGTADDTENVAENLYVTNETFHGFYVGYSLKRNIRVGTITGLYTYAATGISTAFKDDGSGGLVNSATNATVGYIDYDRGFLVFVDDGNVISSVIINYKSMDFANRSGEIANILLSPYTNTIPMSSNEYPILDVLKLEVDWK